MGLGLKSISHILQASNYFLFDISWSHILLIATSPKSHCCGNWETGAMATLIHDQWDDGRRGTRKTGTIRHISQNYTGRRMQTVCHCSQGNGNCAQYVKEWSHDGKGVIRYKHRHTHMRHLVMRQGVIIPTTEWDVNNSVWSGNERWDTPRCFYKANTKVYCFTHITKCLLR